MSSYVEHHRLRAFHFFSQKIEDRLFAARFDRVTFADVKYLER
jgi:hypothetical protein